MPDIAGLKLIVPTSVAGSGVSVSASGKVTLTACSSANINGCFTSSYDNYLIVMRFKAASGNPNANARLRVSGTDASAANYTRQYLGADSTTVVGTRYTSQTEAVIGFTSTGESGTHVYIYGPQLAQPTAFRSVCASSYLSAMIQDDAHTHSLSTAYDGITIFPSSSTLTGALTIYGLSQ